MFFNVKFNICIGVPELGVFKVFDLRSPTWQFSKC